ncbi:hypothetical protein HZH66_002101 [Vespula vulgaris]|uniref:Uncharacterized protein n=1 Tax=Vespula vulgaris TaxID=7454 RepID=A0A834KMH2_VESVU|nr:hypothetical protein HZH66_002101 [Vespula vulgaris]
MTSGSQICRRAPERSECDWRGRDTNCLCALTLVTVSDVTISTVGPTGQTVVRSWYKAPSSPEVASSSSNKYKNTYRMEPNCLANGMTREYKSTKIRGYVVDAYCVLPLRN